MSTLSPKGRELIRAGQRAFRPTDADRARLLSALRSQLGDAALPTHMSPVASAVAAAPTVWPVISAVVVGVGILSGAIFYTLRSGGEHTSATIAATAPVAEPMVEPMAELAAALAAEQPIPAPEVPAVDAPEISPPATASAHRPHDRLAAEVAILSRATRDLRAGHPAEALAALDEYQHKFAKGLLGEEQRAARAQALCALGRFDEAKTKLASLTPRSPLAARAKQFCEASKSTR
jgi:hypothetical protein